MTKQEAQALYRELEEIPAGEQRILATVMEGPKAGEKTLDTQCQETENFRGSRLERTPEGSIFREYVHKPPRMVICGAGHVAIAILKIARDIGFYTVVLEDRPTFANQARAVGADQVICQEFAQGMEELSEDTDTYFVIVTRGHRFDTLCLEAALKKPHAYVGMMGSRKRVALIREQLEKQGFSRETLSQVHAPIGLSIGAETPEEIAVSVMAQIIQVKNQQLRGGGYDQELLDCLCGRTLSGQSLVLATIVERQGSAPRAVGTKLVAAEDGTVVGTIGGGCMEAAVLQRARRLLRSGEPGPVLVTVNMTNQEAEDAGMVCGGVETVALEVFREGKC